MALQEPDTLVDFATLVRRHQSGLWRYLRALGCDDYLADDLTQDSFLKLFQSSFEFRGHAATAALLRTIARNSFISHCRKQGRQVNLDDFDVLDRDWSSLIQDEDGEELLWALRRCFDHLTDRAQEVVKLRYAEDASREQIALTLGMRENGVKTVLRRSRDALRGCIERTIRQSNQTSPGGHDDE